MGVDGCDNLPLPIIVVSLVKAEGETRRLIKKKIIKVGKMFFVTSFYTVSFFCLRNLKFSL